ncbi:MAG: NAD(P)-binding domain-containing protein [Paracoccaceae bacterium]|nr:NAD(P)-binding domain-containing protein [Paracoccaceae bacterium]
MPAAPSNTARAKAPHPADLIEAGRALNTARTAFSDKTSISEQGADLERHNTVIIGAGQAGLSVSYHLKSRGVGHIVLDSANRIGDTWRNRWDSLRLFTPAKFDGLDGFPFPAGKDEFPTKDQMADYLEGYAARFELPVRLNSPVRKLRRCEAGFEVLTEKGAILAKHVVVAAASYQKPRIPPIASSLDSAISQIHSRDYKAPKQIPEGRVLLVGAGNSGAEIAMDLAKTHDVVLAGRDVGHVPFDISGFMGRKMLVRLVIRGMFHHVLTMRTPMGRKFRSKMHDRGMPLIRTRPGQFERAGVRRVGRILSFDGDTAVSDSGDRTRFDSVIWCTGYHSGFDWIDLPVLDERGAPRHRFGKASDVDGLYFAGIHFQYAVSSTMVAGVGRDARRVADWVAARPALSSSPTLNPNRRKIS